jgi:hypothetical protein
VTDNDPLDPTIAKRISDAVRMFGLLGCSPDKVQRVHGGEDIGDPMMEVAIKRELEVADD